ncbi:uncharacterized protein [Palaemon carinicauda]|uniref:uncharacterized protein n=1 Tax=Palaemon carinicauda TaxID=392227 RepID=UPI0035B5F041
MNNQRQRTCDDDQGHELQSVARILGVSKTFSPSGKTPFAFGLLKTTNKTFRESLWQHECGRAVMQAAGWDIVGETVQLPPHINLQLPLEVLLANRNVKPDEREWVEETKVMTRNPAVVREEELKKKALIQKEKEMAALKKEMAERKAIAERIRAEHRSDQESKRITKPSVAVPRGKGEVAKMSDRLPQGG